MTKLVNGDVLQITVNRPSGALLGVGDLVTFNRVTDSGKTWVVEDEGGEWWIEAEVSAKYLPGVVSVRTHAEYVKANQDLARRLQDAEDALEQILEALRARSDG